ncbi:MAG: AgmX/PglI C-terminal domain-containing protein [Polyangiaceae bacterium]|nr:AgmX/PglI C-terminal domain-containing protein [Polyangiaceae bacterium]
MAQSNSVNPFLSTLTNFDARAAFGLERAKVASDDGPMGYALVKSGPAVTAEECENVAARAVEVTVLWGNNIIHVVHLDPPRAFAVGERASQVTLPSEKLGTDRLEIVSMLGEEPCVTVPAGATARVTRPSGTETVAAGSTIPLALGARIDLTFGDLSVQVAGVHPGKRSKRAYFADDDSSAAGFFALSAGIVAAFVGAMAFFVPAMGLTEDEGRDNERLVMIQQYLSASAERNRELDEKTAEQADHEKGGGERAEAARGDSGALGKPTAKLANKRAGVAGPKDNLDPHLAREQALAEARSIGMIGLLNSVNGGDPNAPTSPFGRDSSLGTDDKSAQGNMWGDDIGESWGSNGLGLTGIGEGSGGKGEGIGIGGIGTCGGTICSGLEGGFGRSLGRNAPGHQTRAPRIAIQPATVNGHLPGEVVQRIVRQNYGRFRMCYEQGLNKNPNLQGRVAVRFVIGRDGAVSNVSNAGSDLPDSGVVSCVVGAYYGLSFPAPENGIVTVSYPIMFTPG